MPESDTVVLDSPSEPQQVQLAVAGGEAVAYTRRDPLKESENEDTVAVIPYGPEAAILVVADGAGGLPAGKRASFTAVSTLAETGILLSNDEVDWSSVEADLERAMTGRLAIESRLAERARTYRRRRRLQADEPSAPAQVVGVSAHHFGNVTALVIESDLHLIRIVDHVMIGHDVSVCRDDDARATAHLRLCLR